MKTHYSADADDLKPECVSPTANVAENGTHLVRMPGDNYAWLTAQDCYDIAERFIAIGAEIAQRSDVTPSAWAEVA